MKRKFQRPISILLTIIMIMSLFTIIPTASAATITDTLNVSFSGVNSTSYTSWNNKTGTSGAVYAGIIAKNSNNIQLNSKNNAGIIVTSPPTGYTVKNVTVTWDSTTTNGNKLDVYGKNSAYTSSANLYSSSAQGDLLGSIAKGTDTELSIDGNYSYIGMRSKSGALYITSIEIEWDDGSSTPSYYTVTWKNYEGTELEKDTGLASGATPSYDGEEPTKASDADYDYTFSGWKRPGDDNLYTDTFPAVDGDVTYTAQFTESAIPEYTVKWYTDDECTDLLLEQTYKRDAVPFYDGTPTKASDDEYNYYFNGSWKNSDTDEIIPAAELPAVSGDVNYIAQFTAVAINKFTVTWVDCDGRTLETDLNVNKNTTPEFNGETPTRGSDEYFSYTFAGWSPAVAPVKADVTYTAVYTAEPLTMAFKVIRTDGDTEFNLKGKYYDKSGTPTQFEDDGSFDESLLYVDMLYLADEPVAYVDAPDYASYAHSVYVTGSGTEDDPFVFTPNYIYARPDNSGVANGVAVSGDGTYTGNVQIDAHPGDGFKKYSKVRVDFDLSAALFLQHADDGANHCHYEYVGIGNGNYGYDYNGVNAAPYDFLNGNDTLYFLGQKGSESVYMFTESVPYSDDLGDPLITYTVTWENYNGNTLDSGSFVVDTIPTYNGDTPVKPNDDNKYTFTGWKKDGDDTLYTDAFPAVDGDVTYTAQYSSTPLQSFTVRWFANEEAYINDDPLLTETVKEEATPVYSGSTPVREKDTVNEYRYAFNDTWIDVDDESTPIASDSLPGTAKDTDYIAQFDAIKYYTIYWYDGNIDPLYSAEVDEGTVPVYGGTEDITKADHGDYYFTFSGKWYDYYYDTVLYDTDSLPPASADTDYIANFTRHSRHPIVTWYNDDDDTDILEIEQYDHGDKPSYPLTSPAPSRPDDTYRYTFDGYWTDKATGILYDGSDLPELTDDTEYVAHYTKKLICYILWQDDDGTELDITECLEGETPSYSPAPTKPDDGTYTYTFTGWSPEITEATGDATYTAQYSRVKLHPEVRWLNYNSSIIATETYNAGDIPTYKGDTPTRLDSGDYRYTFTGWDPEPSEVYDDVDYTAQYSSALIPTYTVTWVEHDGTTESTVKDGYRPVYDGTPAKYFEGVWGYEFAGWTDGTHTYMVGEPLPYASGSVTYTAVYQQEELKDCTVTWLNYNGDILETEVVKEGTLATYKGASNPTRASDGEHTYVFSGWSPEPGVVLGDIEFTAVFTQAPLNAAGFVPTDDDKTYTMLEGKWFLADPDDEYPGYFSENGKFEVSGNKLMLAGEQIGTISTGTGKAFANTVYVTGSGSYEDPYVFTVNYKYGTNSYIIIKNGTTVNMTDVNPGDQFIGTARIKVNTDVENITFMADPSVKQKTPNGFIGVGQNKYGYAYSGENAISYNGHGPYDFGLEDEGYSYTLYYHGLNSDGDAHTFSTANITLRPDFIGTISEGDWIISWHNWDDSELYPDEYYYDGDMPSYKGDTPTRPADDTYTYVFGGWDHMIIPATYSFTYKAKFIEIPKDQSQPISDIEWIFPTDGGKTYEMEHMYYLYDGEIKVFPGDGVLTDDGEHVYMCGETVADIGVTFSHEKMTAEFIHTVFVEGTGKHSDPFIFHPNYYYSSTMSTIGTGTTVYLGDDPASDSVKGYPGDSYQGNSRVKIDYEPIRFLPEETYHTGQYRFIGIGTDTYGYEYDHSQAYPYTYKSDDKKLWFHGHDDYGYVFAEYPASYQQGFGDPETFTITWKNYDGEVLSTETDAYYYDDTPEYKGETPVKPAYSRFTYTFSGWDPEVETVTENKEYTATYTETSKLFVHHSLTLNGDIGVNFYLDVTEDEITTGSGVTVDFSWNVEGNVKRSSYKLKTTESAVKNGKTYYKATCWVAAAEMTYDIHATATINGVLEAETDDYNVRQYGMTILNSPEGTFDYQDELVYLVKTMLDYGSKAQIVFSRKTNDLANKYVEDYTMADVDADTIAQGDRDLTTGLEDIGLEYYNTSVVFLTKTSLRIYYRIVDQSKFDAVKNSVTFNGEKVDYVSKSGYIYYEVSDIAAADLDEAQTLSFGDKCSFDYTILDFAKKIVNNNTPEQQELGKATYWYNVAAKAYFSKANG